MGAIGITFKIVTFPFRLLFGSTKKKKGEDDQKSDIDSVSQAASTPMQDLQPDNMKAKVDLMLAQMDSLKLEYETINQRIQNIERMVREMYAMSKS